MNLLTPSLTHDSEDSSKFHELKNNLVYLWTIVCKKTERTQFKKQWVTQHMAWPEPYACAQPNDPWSGIHGQLFYPWWGSSTWRSSLKVLCHKDFAV